MALFRKATRDERERPLFDDFARRIRGALASDGSQRASAELTILDAIATGLINGHAVADVMDTAFETMSEELGLNRCALTLAINQGEAASIAASHGFTADQLSRGQYGPGEGITGEVIRTGQQRVITDVASDGSFLNRTGAHVSEDQALSFVCVPIPGRGRAIGALSADRAGVEKESLDTDVRFFNIVAVMIAQAVEVRQTQLRELDHREREKERLLISDRGFRPKGVIGSSKRMLGLYDQLASVAKGATTVLLLGESGTGKELLAQAIHENSARASRPLVAVNCSALPEALIESELFGHERGAFTGASSMRKGRFELANGGTIFLDEIGEMSLSVQVKLLRVLQERTFERVGGATPIKCDVRVVTATHRDLDEAVRDGTFRKDLFYRLNVFPLRVPPLRERKTDLLQLADFFVERFNAMHGTDVRRISTQAIDMLMAYHWPGNVRELENCIERAVLLAREEAIQGRHLPPTLQTPEATGFLRASGSMAEALEAVECEMILDALKATRGNMAKAARQLGITERVMGLRVKRFEIEPKRFRT